MAENANTDGGMSGAGAGGSGSDNGSRSDNRSDIGSGLTVGSTPSFGAGYGISPTGLATDPGLNPATSRADAGMGLTGAPEGSGGYVSTPDQYSFTSPVTYGQIAAMEAAGYGAQEGMNPNNPTQTVSQIDASKAFHDLANETVPGMAMSFATSMVSPAIATALKLAMAMQNNTVGQTVGGLLGNMTGIAAARSVGSLLGRSVDTGRAPTTSDVSAIGLKSVADMVGASMAKAGYASSGTLGGVVAGGLGKAATNSLGTSLGIGKETSSNQTTQESSSRNTVSSTTGGKR